MPSKRNSSAAAGSDRGKLGVIFLTLFLDLAGFSVIFPLYPSLLEWYFPRFEEAGVLSSIVSWASEASGGLQAHFLAAVLFGGFLGTLYSGLQFVFAPIWGRMSDRIGRRPVLLMTVGFSALGYLLWVFSESFWVFLVSRALCGIMAGNLSVASAAIADITSKEQRTRGMALVGIAFGMGFLIGPVIGGLATLVSMPALLPGVHPFSASALAALVLSVINWVWIWKAFPETLPEKDAGRTAAGAAELAQLWRRDKALIRHISLVNFVFLFAFSGMEFTLTFLALERLGYGPADNIYIFLFVGFVLIAVQGGVVRRLSGKVSELNLVFSGLCAGLLGLVLLAVAADTLWFYGGLALMGVGIGLCSPALSALASLYTSADRQGEVQGAFRAAGSLARALGPLAAAVLFWQLGSAAAYATGAGIVFAALMLALVLPKPQQAPVVE